MTKEQKIIYLAGLFDGEGCVLINKATKRRYSYHRLRVQLTNLNPSPLKMAMELFGGSILIHKNRRENQQDIWDWSVEYTRAVEFLEEIFPYSIIKKDEIEIALDFMNSKKRYGRGGVPINEFRKRERFKQELQELKRQPYLM